MKFKFSAIIAIIFVSFLASADTAKILGLFTSFGKSHLIVYMSVIRALTDRGHNVTVVTTQPVENRDGAFRHIQVTVPGSTKDFLKDAAKNPPSSPLGIFRGLNRITGFVTLQANASLHDPQMRKIMDEESFDLVLVGYFFNDFQIGVAGHFKCPLAIVFTHRPMQFLGAMVGYPLEPLYVPHIFFGPKQPLGFLGRLGNVLMHSVDFVLFSMLDYVYMKPYYDYNFPSNKYPSYDAMKRNVSLILVNHHFINGPIRPTVPAVVEIGGIQIKPKTDPLPDDLKKFIDEAKDGVIFFSMGSNARSADLNPDMITNVYSVLSSLKQRVVWKWEEDKTPGKAENIFFGKWLPQDDILAHPNVKLFVTHGGHGSVVESEYHGVPMVGIPLFADQFANMDSVENSGYGITLGKQSLTAEAFREALMEVLTNPKYRDNVQSFSKLYRDRPMSARDTAAFWIEYVIRHRGAKHMQSPAVHMSTIEYYGLDIMAFLLVVGYIIVKVVKITFRFLISLCCGKKGKKQEDERKNKTKKIQ